MMAKKPIEFTKSAPVDGRWYHAGEVAGFPDETAEKVIAAGKAKPFGVKLSQTTVTKSAEDEKPKKRRGRPPKT